MAIAPEQQAEAKKVEDEAADPKADALAERLTEGDTWGQIGEAFGEGGLGLTGIGEGGGGRGENVGLGRIGTLGHGAGTGTGQGFGSGSGGLGGTHTKSHAKVQAATASTTGSGLSPEVIRRVVRRKVGAIRYCYEKAMTKNPTLGGKVAVKFTIDAKGTVSSASASDTTISDAEMVSCVVTAVRGLSFPQPENGGTVVVTYPFHFSPGDN